jgi:hypothetical protein
MVVFRRHSMTVLSATCVVAAWFSGVAATEQVFQCRDASGKVTFSNVPCGGEQPKARGAEEDPSDYGTFYGEWRGQAQFKETVAGQTAGTAHIVAPLVIKIEPGGKVTGASTETGCRVLGVARPGPVATVPSFDLTLSECRHAVFNRRYSGSLGLYTQQRYATIQLISVPSLFAAQAATYDISGTLKR